MGEVSRATFERERMQILTYEAALDRALPKTLGPMMGSKKNFTPPELPTYDVMLQRRHIRETFSPSGVRYDSANERDQFVDYQWWKVKDNSILKKKAGSEEVQIGGNKALNHQHYDSLGHQGLTKEDADGLDQS